MTTFGGALQTAIDRAGVTQARLAKALGVTPAAVNNWVKGENDPTPTRAFAAEDHLGLPPGSLSRHLGYVPVGSVSVLAAIDADPRLDEDAKRRLRLVYEAFID